MKIGEHNCLLDIYGRGRVILIVLSNYVKLEFGENSMKSFC